MLYTYVLIRPYRRPLCLRRSGVPSRSEANEHHVHLRLYSGVGRPGPPEGPVRGGGGPTSPSPDRLLRRGAGSRGAGPAGSPGSYSQARGYGSGSAARGAGGPAGRGGSHGPWLRPWGPFPCRNPFLEESDEAGGGLYQKTIPKVDASLSRGGVGQALLRVLVAKRSLAQVQDEERKKK